MSLIEFNSEQKMIQNEIRKFAQTELEPRSSEIDKKGVFPFGIIKKLSDLGFLSLIVPEKYGGAALDTMSLCIVLEELSKSCASIGTILATNNCLVAYPIMKYGSEDKKNYYLEKLAQGKIGAYVVSPYIDLSDKQFDIKETAGNYLISGRQDFVLNGEAADFSVIPISLVGEKTICAFENGAGVSSVKHDILGMRAAGIVGFEFRDFALMNDKCLVSKDMTEEVFQKLCDFSNIGFAAISLGIAEGACDASIKYSKERRQFNRAICEFPMVQEMLVDMKTKIEAARYIIYDAAVQCDKGLDCTLNANLARLLSNEAAVFSGIKSIQVHGGYGYIKDYPVERFLRDAKVSQVLHASPQSLKSNVAKELLK